MRPCKDSKLASACPLFVALKAYFIFLFWLMDLRVWSDIVSFGVGSKSSLILFLCSQCRIVWSSSNSCCSTSRLHASHCGHPAALQPVRSSEAIDVRSFGQETCPPECRYARHQRVQLCLDDSNSVIACNRWSIAYTAFILTLLKTFLVHAMQ